MINNPIKRAGNAFYLKFKAAFEFRFDNKDNFVNEILSKIATLPFGKPWSAPPLAKKVEKVLFLMIGLFICMFLMARALKKRWMLDIVELSEIILYLMWALHAIIYIWGAIKEMFPLYPRFIENVAIGTAEELKFMKWLKKFPDWQLEYVAGTLESHCGWVEGKLQILMTTITKFPLFLSSGMLALFYHFLLTHNLATTTSLKVTAIVVAVMILFILFIHFHMTNRSQRAISLIRQVIAIKQAGRISTVTR